MATIQVRVPDKNKKNVEEIFASLGLDITTAVRMFFARVEMDHGLPFPVTQRKNVTINGFTPEFEAEVLAAAGDELSPAFNSATEAVAYLHSLNPSKKKK